MPGGRELQKPLINQLITLIRARGGGEVNRGCEGLHIYNGSLYKARKGSMTLRLSTVLEILDAMGLGLEIVVKDVSRLPSGNQNRD